MADQGHLTLYLFGDQTFDVQPHLRDLMRHRHNPVLENFLAKALDAIRAELYTLPREMHERLPRFTSVDELLLRRQGGKACLPLDMAMTCLYQLGAFIAQADPWDFSRANTAIVGLCTGALAAAAVSCSRSTLDLVPLAVDAVVVAFRTGMRVNDVAQRIEPSEAAADQSWSVIMPGAASAEVVHDFCKQTPLPLTSQPYVSAYAPHGITVSGPPRALAALAHGSDLAFRNIPIHGPFHAPHLYSHDDVNDIVGSLSRREDADAHASRLPLFSSTDAPADTSVDFHTSLKAAVSQILLRPIRWNVVLEHLVLFIEQSGCRAFSVTPIATRADQLVYTALKQSPVRELLSPAPGRPPAVEDAASSGATPGKPKLAIIAMSGRFPGANDNEAFWDLLYQGLDVHKPAPALHWDVKTHVDPTGRKKNTSATPFGCWLEEPALFDARFFNISPREAPQIDPAQRLALMTAYEAIEQAGIVPDATPSTRRDRVGVFYGVTSNDWMETNSAQNIDTYFIPGGNRAFIPGRINYCFKFSGPSYAVDTACSSSLAAIHLACNSLWRGDIDTAIAGGTNVLTNPDFTAGLDRGHFLSRTGNCKTFDDGADGYCRGEGIGTVIIKRLDDALADKDPILGLILGAYTNHSAESESITRPHVGAQRAVFSKILNQGAVDPYSVGYVEMHGTGTQAGDAGEMSSVLDTFAPPLDQVKRGRNADEALYLGSAKANIGHGEAASGVSSLIKVLLMMQKNTIVPHCGIKTKINHKFPTDLEQRNVHIALQPTPWPRSLDAAKPRRVFVNNFSAAGGNSALLLEDAPLKVPSDDSILPDPRTQHLVAVSAKNGVSLQGNLRSLLAFLRKMQAEGTSAVDLGKLSYTTTARRIHHQHRVMLAGATAADLCTHIETALRDQTGMTRPKSAPRVLFAFTGQGAQYPGMGKQLYENFSLFRTEIRRLDQIGQGLGFPSMLAVITSEDQDIDTFAPISVQLANLCLQIALSRLWASWNVFPTAVVGHSLGEYAALNIAGVLSDADAIYLVGKRAELLQAKCTRGTHAMLVVKGSVDEIATVLKEAACEVACINSPNETVLAGPLGDIETFKARLADSGLKSTLLKVPYAFHSAQIDVVLGDYERIAAGVTYSKPKISILCPLDGSIIAEGNGGVVGAAYLARHSRQPVNMMKALQSARDGQVLTDQTMTLEIGPHPAISGMIKPVLGQHMTTLASLQRGRPVWQVLGSTLKVLYTAGADINWSGYHADFTASHEVLPLPAYSWDLKEYWMQYVNDWSLRKGDPPLVITNHAARLESTTIHRVVEETGDAEETHIVVEANIARDDLSPLVQGHEVDGIPLCTPSVYADMALSLGTYLLDRYRPQQQERLVDVSDMTISKALILRTGATEQPLQAHAHVDWLSNAASVKFMSFDSKQKLQEHARCVVRFRDGSLRATLQKGAAHVKRKIQELRDGIATGVTARFNRPMVYRAIRPLARFHDDYRAIDEIVLNSRTLEACSRLSFGSVKRGGTFHTHPAIIDSLTQSCGFTMNCNDASDLDVEVFMNHGWGSFQIFEPLDFDKVYTTYTHMTEGKDKLWHGDVVIFDGDEVVAFFGQIAIQGVPRRVLKVILSIESGSRASQKQQQHHVEQKQQATTTAAPVVNAVQGLSSLAPEQVDSRKLALALSIIAEESGLATSDLTDNTVFADVGIDSLLGLTISARFKEELDADLDFNALFFEYPTVADLKRFLGFDSLATTPVPKVPSSAATPDASATPRSSATGTTTPLTEEPSQSPKVDFKRALQIVSEESGVAIEDLTDDTSFADAGVDSLLSLIIVSRFRDELELDIQHESLFLECPTVADLRQSLLGGGGDSPASVALSVIGDKPVIDIAEAAATAAAAAAATIPSSQPSAAEKATLAARKKAVDDYVEKYTAGFAGPTISPTGTLPSDDEKVILVTGASGSLGGHLVYHMAQLPDVKTVVCLNRPNKAEPHTRQYKAMREKGIRFPEALKHKLLVLQTDSAEPLLGLSRSLYDELAGSVTHLIHNAWPMSAKRPLAGFESQFQVMRNLVDFARDAASRRPAGFRFAFQMVSSIGVVGHYGLSSSSSSSSSKVVVPEDRVGIDAVLPNGYGEAKWGCELMLDATLHRFPACFRPMVVRLGQIAGSKTSGYWNPMEHFGFLVKSSQTLGALPDVPGTAYWTPVNDVAGALADLLLLRRGGGDNATTTDSHPVYHIENPVGQPWPATTRVLADALGIRDLVPFDDWVARVRAAPMRDNPAATLLEFLDGNYLRMSCGGLVLGVSRALEHSPTLAAVGPVSDDVVRKYVHIWREIGFLNK
ncbi:ketoacyl-synt-domain-containing protein [Achaetomium macrosporum]|uniref:Ketoacyl-synt-domain-containing protein n=1 Tax=Achaetomium macrosporum TaxID=79813 RepID=A0AAN7C6F5_9PEZI|nr:ketoacyl-synt-domain-containing protein [Achaetomium macrosporum]